MGPQTVRLWGRMEASLSNFLLLVAAGIAGAAFGLPMRYFRGWRWEHVWIGQALTSNIIFPLGTLLLLWPAFRPHVGVNLAARGLLVLMLGVLWGLGGIGYGISLVRLGLSFTYSVLFSVTTVCGALLPFCIRLQSRPPHLLTFLLGLLFCVLGAVAVGRAAARRSLERKETSDQISSLAVPVARGSYTSSLLIVLFAGVFSAAMGMALVLNEGLISGLVKGGVSAVMAPLIVWVPLGIGSGSVSIAFGLYCAHRSASLAGLYQAFPLRNWLLVTVMGVLGFGVLLLYGLGASAEGHPSKNVAWAVYMTSYILFGNCFGLMTREWKDCSLRTYAELLAGITLLLGAIGSLAVS